jgi:hypothetical protein
MIVDNYWFFSRTFVWTGQKTIKLTSPKVHNACLSNATAICVADVSLEITNLDFLITYINSGEDVIAARLFT